MIFLSYPVFLSCAPNDPLESPFLRETEMTLINELYYFEEFTEVSKLGDNYGIHERMVGNLLQSINISHINIFLSGIHEVSYPTNKLLIFISSWVNYLQFFKGYLDKNQVFYKVISLIQLITWQYLILYITCTSLQLWPHGILIIGAIRYTYLGLLRIY